MSLATIFHQDSIIFSLRKLSIGLGDDGRSLVDRLTDLCTKLQYATVFGYGMTQQKIFFKLMSILVEFMDKLY
jgi:hypothetical protein